MLPVAAAAARREICVLRMETNAAAQHVVGLADLTRFGSCAAHALSANMTGDSKLPAHPSDIADSVDVHRGEWTVNRDVPEGHIAGAILPAFLLAAPNVDRHATQREERPER